MHPDHWWYVAREWMMEPVFAGAVPADAVALEIGSADGPSTAWLRARAGHRIATDIDPSGLRPGDVCADAVALPFRAGSFDVVAAFDVIEHVERPGDALREIRRVLRPDGVLLLSVPAYEWAWTHLDDRAGHHRRYTRDRLRSELEDAGFECQRITHAFMGTFPLFAVDRGRSRLTGASAAGTADGDPAGWVRRLLLRLGRLDARLLARGVQLPFGSSIFALATIAARDTGRS